MTAEALRPPQIVYLSELDSAGDSLPLFPLLFNDLLLLLESCVSDGALEVGDRSQRGVRRWRRLWITQSFAHDLSHGVVVSDSQLCLSFDRNNDHSFAHSKLQSLAINLKKQKEAIFGREKHQTVILSQYCLT